MFEPPNEEGLVSFEEVAVYFSEEEWSWLDPDQKALHWEVMMENYRNVASLVQDSCELFQVIKVEDGMEESAIQTELENHERNQSKNWNPGSSSSIDAPMQDFLDSHPGQGEAPGGPDPPQSGLPPEGERSGAASPAASFPVLLAARGSSALRLAGLLGAGGGEEGAGQVAVLHCGDQRS
ncbi:zinc finger protein [Crotalus adamanteus]|uniref:Zinc finger protein n=1 Tax=Crotalus adamanteus TaxID=8729 RepID=A0AAW1BTL4_CROAD